MFTCATCKKRSCLLYDQKNPPLNCPMQDQITLQECKKAYFDNDGGKLYLSTFETAAEAKELNETRLLEAIRFAKKNGWKKIGIAHCIGFCKEAAVASKLIKNAGLECESVVCTNGGINLCEYTSIPENHLDDKEHNYAVGCNPIGQAKYLEKANTDFNLIFGLCVGHDALFTKHSHVLTSVIMVKDRSRYRDSVVGLFAAGCQDTNEN